MQESERVVVVVGAGTMGRGIALVAALSGYETRLVDAEPRQLDSAITFARRHVARESHRDGWPSGRADAVLGRLRPSTELGLAVDRSVCIAIEAVVEDLEVKQRVLGELERGLAGDALVATNTSSLSVSRVGGHLERPERFLGLHFFNPVTRMDLCEVVRSDRVSEPSLAAAVTFAQSLGKQTVIVEDLPGFATSRISALLGNEAFRMLEEGVASAVDIDTAVRVGLNHPMGPLELGDLVGLDVRLAVLESLEQHLGGRFRPTDTHRRLVTEGRLGRKAGRGVFEYGASSAGADPTD